MANTLESIVVSMAHYFKLEPEAGSSKLPQEGVMAFDLDHLFWNRVCNTSLPYEYETYFVAMAKSQEIILYARDNSADAKYSSSILQLSDFLVASDDTNDLA